MTLATLKKQIQAKQEGTDGDVAKFEKELQGFLRKNLNTILKGLGTGDVSRQDAARTLGGLLSSLRAAGLQAVLDRVSQLYSRELGRIQDFYQSHTGQTFHYTDSDRSVVEALVRFDTDQIANGVDTYANELRRLIFQQVIAGGTPDINALVETNSERSAAQATTDLNTSMAGLSRTINMSKGVEQGFERFLYYGGLIATSREFCQERDGKIFTLEEIQSWDNGQGLPADVYLGGYNCRHELLPVDDEILSNLGVE